MDAIIELTPVFKNYIWGGRKLADEFGYDIPDGPVGECWAISAHPNGDCTVASGTYAGQTLSWLWAHHRELFADCPCDRFPLLIKIIDAKEDLSIQVHPNDTYAAEHENGSLGKRECWYVLSAEPGQTVIVGQRARTREEFEQMAAAGHWNELVCEIPISAGDFFQIDTGTVHAIKGGTVVLETQQSSDITYRVYDFDRRQADGTLRELHMAKALDVIDFDRKAPVSGAVTPAEGPVQTLEHNECYTVDLVHVDGELTIETPHPFTCVSVIAGEGVVCGRAVAKGSHLLALAACDALELAGAMELVLSYL